MNALIEMRSSCRECGGELGRIDTRGGQDVVFCAGCGKWAGYNASKAETGREVRSLRTRGRIKPKQRARILERDNATCVLCHRADVEARRRPSDLREGRSGARAKRRRA